jgi:hypothetical protein
MIKALTSNQVLAASWTYRIPLFAMGQHGTTQKERRVRFNRNCGHKIYPLFWKSRLATFPHRPHFIRQAGEHLGLHSKPVHFVRSSILQLHRSGVLAIAPPPSPPCRPPPRKLLTMPTRNAWVRPTNKRESRPPVRVVRIKVLVRPEPLTLRRRRRRNTPNKNNFNNP